MKQILCYGDSNTYGLIPGTQERYAWAVRWTGILNDRLAAYGYRIVEEGLCGRTTMCEDPLRSGRNGRQMLPMLLETHSPLECVILMLGTNDCKTEFGLTAELIGQGMSRLLEQVRAIQPDAGILLMSPIWLSEGVGETGFDPQFDQASVTVSHKLKEIYRELASRFGCGFLAASDFAQASEVDREHLDEVGHQILSGVVFDKLKSDILDL